MSAYLKLCRNTPVEKAVKGHLYLIKRNEFDQEITIPFCDTLENNDYIIPPLIYRLTVTYSPRFQRPLPLVNQVPRTPGKSDYRTGIRFHPGTRPEHSKGCILVSREAEEKLSQLIRHEKEVYLDIC